MSEQVDHDARILAEMGYKQSLDRAWSGFSNFAISFSIISILAGCFTSYLQAWNNGGPVAISWGWLIISIPILIIGLVYVPYMARPIRGEILALREKEFIEAAVASAQEI